MQPAGLAVGAMFAMFLAVEITALSQLTDHSIDDVFGLMTFLFVAFWALGWSVGVVILGLLTALFLFYKESARLQGNRLVHVPRLGPLNIATRIRPCEGSESAARALAFLILI